MLDIGALRQYLTDGLTALDVYEATIDSTATDTVEGLAAALMAADVLYDVLGDGNEVSIVPHECDVATDALLRQAIADTLRGTFRGWGDIALPLNQSPETVGYALIGHGLATAIDPLTHDGRYMIDVRLDEADQSLLYDGWERTS